MNKYFHSQLLHIKIGKNYLVWFEQANRYVILSDFLFDVITNFLEHPEEKSFLQCLKNKDISTNQGLLLFEDIKTFLRDLYVEHDLDDITITNIPPNLKRELFQIQGKIIEINTSNHSILELITQPLKLYRKNRTEEISDSIYDIFLKDQIIYLYQNKSFVHSYPENEIHFIQGKFLMELLNSLYSKTETDWLATFHASTVINNEEAIMLIGASGNGKSTLTALLIANGFELLADDFTPMSFENHKLYRNPNAISIKEGAFHLFQNSREDLNETKIYLNPKKKIKVKYISSSNTDKLKVSYPCKKIVYIEYHPTANNSFETSSPDLILNTLIPESWISPRKEHAQAFLEWIETCEFYKLSYQDNKFAIDKMKEL